jgi:hypothetical protein
VIPVAILGSDALHISRVDVATFEMGPSGAMPKHPMGGHLGDVNGDGLTDLTSHYRTQATRIAWGDGEVCISGELTDGIPFEGCDAIQTVPSCGVDTSWLSW